MGIHRRPRTGSGVGSGAAVWGFEGRHARDAFDQRDAYRGGTTYRERGGFGPFTFETEWRITDWEPPHRQVHRSEFAGMDVVLRSHLEPVANGTNYRQAIEIDSSSRDHPLGRVIERGFARWLIAPSLRHIVSNLKTTVESESR